MKRAFALHQTLGRALAAVLLFVLLSGALAAVSMDMEAMLEARGASGISEHALDVFEASERARGETILRVMLPTEEHGAWALVRLEDRTFERAFLREDGSVAARLPRVGAVQVLRDLHRALLLGHVGLYAVTPTSILMIVLLVSGVLSQKRFVWRPQGMQREARLSSWHRVLGTYALLPGLFFAVTGAFYIAETLVEDAGGSLEVVPPRADTGDASCAGRMTLSDVMRLVHHASPQLSPREVAFAQDGDVVTLFGPGPTSLVRDIGSFAVVNRCEGRVLGAHVADTEHPLDLLADVVDTLHFGRFGASLLRTLWCALGLLLAALATTGWLRTAGREGFRRDALVFFVMLAGLVLRGVFRSWHELSPSGLVALGLVLATYVALVALVMMTQRKSAVGRGSSRTNVNQ